MKITVTYRSSYQINVNDYNTETFVIHLDEGMTLKQAYEKIKKQHMFRGLKDFNGEIQFNDVEEKE